MTRTSRSAMTGVAAAGILMAGILSACNPADIDPTDPGNFSSISFVNDTRSEVVLYECSDTRGRDCHDMSGTLAAGQRSDQRVSWGVGATPWQVRDPGGRMLGWLLVNSPRREAGAVYYIGDAEAQPEKETAPHEPGHPISWR